MKKLLQVFIGLIIFIVGFYLFKSIDFIELYLYNLFSLLSFNIAAILTRIIIASIIALGLSNIFLLSHTNFNKKIALLLVLFFVIIFVLDLNKNYILCNCFYYKAFNFRFNFPFVLLFISFLLLIINNNTQFFVNYQKTILSILFIATLTILTILSAPDFLLNEKEKENIIELNTNNISEESSKHLKTIFKKNNKFLIAFVDPECNYCRKSIIKLSIMARKHKLSNKFILLHTSDAEKLKKIFQTFHLNELKYNAFSINDMAQLSKGHFPYIILIKNSKIYYQYNYRNIDENTIKYFLKD